MNTIKKKKKKKKDRLLKPTKALLVQRLLRAEAKPLDVLAAEDDGLGAFHN